MVRLQAVDVVKADLVNPDFGIGLKNAFLGADAIVLATGTSAFPSEKWGDKNSNSPRFIDDEGIKNAVKAIEEINADAAKSGARRIQRVTLLSSIGVQRRNQFPFFILNLFGVLDSKAAGEIALKDASKRAGFQYAIVRPGRLVGGPYTNPDFAKLLQLDEGDMRGVEMRVGDPDGFAGRQQLIQHSNGR
jgi:nucleoside-diphosphate-sugar epimerase